MKGAIIRRHGPAPLTASAVGRATQQFRSRRSRSARLAVAVAVLALSSLWLPVAAHAVAPPAPPSVRAVAMTPTQVIVEWESAANGVTSYQIRRNGVLRATVDAATVAFEDTTVTAGLHYTYVVEAVTAAGTSASAPARVKTPSPPDLPDRYGPTHPEDVAAVAYPDGTVVIDWQSSSDDSDVSAYILRRGGRRIAVVDAGTLRFVDRQAGAAGGKYTVEAVDISGLRSGQSEIATARPAPKRAGASSAPTASGEATTATADTTALSIASFSPSLRRYPYLTDLVSSADGTIGYATINWATDRSSTTGAATWGLVAGDGSCTPVTEVAAARTPLVVNSVLEYQWEANLTLQPDQAYCYRASLGGADLLGTDPSPRFRTQPPPGSTGPISFAVLGDWGQVDSTSSNPDQANLMQLIADSGVSFALTTGDNAYASGSQNNYGDLVETGPELSTIFGPQFWTVAGSSIAMFPAMGNHGFLRNDTNHPHLTNWPQDRAVSESNGRYQRDTYCCLLGTTTLVLPSTWYAFDAGRARIYILQAAWSDSNGGINDDPYEVDAAYQWTPSSAQYQWLEQDLAAHPDQVKMVAFHYPLYSDQKHETSDVHLQGPDSLQGLLNQYDVKLAFNGHAHIYERNLPDSGGMVSYVTGGGGAKTQSVAEEPCLAIDAYAIGWSNSSSTGNACGAATPPSSAAEVFHFLKVTLNGSQLTVEPINSLGQSFDVQTYDVGDPPPPDTEAPSVPTGVSAVATSASLVDVSWSASTDNVGVTGYDVLRDGAVIASVSGSTLSYPDTTVAPATTYSYRVVAKDLADNHSAPSAESVVTTPEAPDTEPPSVPTGVGAVATSSSLVDVSWTASTDNVGVTGYDVLRDGVVIGSVSGSTLTYADSTVVASTTYSYRVVAKDLADNHSAPSAESVVTTPAAPDTTPPSVPTGVGAVAVSSTIVDVSWSASTDDVGVTGYDVLRDGAVIASVGGGTLTYRDSTVVASTTYGYRVVAKDLAGNHSAPSAEAVVTTPPPSGPVTVTFVALEDTYADATTANANFGSATNVFSDTSPAQRGYLKFVASGISGTVQSAVVRLWVTDSTSNAPQLATTSSAWTESTLTWNNQPAAGSVAGDFGSAAKNTFIDYQVTAVVNGDGTYSFVLVAQSSNGLGVASSEASAGNRPQLIVTYD